MKKIGLMLIIAVLCSVTSILVFADIIRFSGSNQNTFINSVEYLPESPPGFGSNLTLRANVTDFENDYIPWVNFTLISPSGYHHINKSNGTQFGDYWNTTAFQINETGIWVWNVTSGDNVTLNTTRPKSSATFTITDDGLRWSPNEITAVTNITTDKLYDLILWTDSAANLNFTFEEDSNGNFTVTLNSSLLISSAEATLSLNISPNASDYGNHSFDITVTRASPLSRAWNISVNIEITDNFGDIEFVSPSEYIITNICPGTFEHSIPVVNYGNYDMTDCNAYLYNSSGDEISSSTNFDLGGGESDVARISYSFSEDIITHFGVYCIASANGSVDYTSNDPKITLIEGADCGDSGGGAGGEVPPRPFVEVVDKAVLPPEPRVCGDGICDEDLGETPWSCPRDCLGLVFKLEDIFCMPMFKCGSWESAWFINGIIIVILSFLIYFMVFKKKGRL